MGNGNVSSIYFSYSVFKLLGSRHSNHITREYEWDRQHFM